MLFVSQGDRCDLESRSPFVDRPISSLSAEQSDVDEDAYGSGLTIKREKNCHPQEEYSVDYLNDFTYLARAKTTSILGTIWGEREENVPLTYYREMEKDKYEHWWNWSVYIHKQHARTIKVHSYIQYSFHLIFFFIILSTNFSKNYNRFYEIHRTDFNATLHP